MASGSKKRDKSSAKKSPDKNAKTGKKAAKKGTQKATKAESNSVQTPTRVGGDDGAPASPTADSAVTNHHQAAIDAFADTLKNVDPTGEMLHAAVERADSFWADIDAVLAGNVRDPDSTAFIRERVRKGAALRDQVPHSAQARFEASTNRPDPVAVLEGTNRGRLPDLVPIRYGRMLETPFTFLRGAPAVMAHDLGDGQRSGAAAQACGDAHLSNFGFFGTPERNLVFDLNDFDETLPAPWEWDVKRLCTSLVVTARVVGMSEADADEAARIAARTYRTHMWFLATSAFLQVWYDKVDADMLKPALEAADRHKAAKRLDKARHKDSLQALGKLAVQQDGRWIIKDDPPLIEHVGGHDFIDNEAERFFAEYRTTLSADRAALFDRYRLVDVARKVVGVGSVGTRCFVALFLGQGGDDPLFLQVKEAVDSVLEPYAGASHYEHAGERVVAGQRYMQASSDLFLGWASFGPHKYYVRQLRDMKTSVDVMSFEPFMLRGYGGLCGWVLARAHARSGEPAVIAGYLGHDESFDEAMVQWAKSYADQTERDHQTLVDAVQSGRIAAITGV